MGTHNMLKNTLQMEHVVEGKLFHFTCDNNAPIGHVKDALNKFIQYTCQVEDNILMQQKQAQEAEETEKNEENPQNTEE